MKIDGLTLTRTDEQLDVALHRLQTANYNLNGRDPKIAAMHTVNGLLIEEALISLGAECGDGIAWDLTLPNDPLKYDVKFAAEGLKSAHGFVRYYSRLLYTARHSQATGLIAGEPLSFTEERVLTVRGKFKVSIWKTARIFYVGPLIV